MNICKAGLRERGMEDGRHGFSILGSRNRVFAPAPALCSYPVEIAAYRRQILGVGAEIGRTMLTIVAPSQDVPTIVQLVGDSSAIDFHAGREHHQIVPLGNLSARQRKQGKEEKGVDRNDAILHPGLHTLTHTAVLTMSRK